MSNESFPIISVEDLGAVVSFYEKFGFSRTYVFPPDGPATFATLERDGSTIGISRRDKRDADRFSYWVYVDDVDASFAAVLAGGAPVVAEPRTEPWGERVASVRTPTATWCTSEHPARQTSEAPWGVHRRAIRSAPNGLLGCRSPPEPAICCSASRVPKLSG